MLPIFLSFMAVSVLAQVRRTSEFIGCSTGIPNTAAFFSPTLNPSQVSPSGCAAACVAIGFNVQYSYFRQADSACGCSGASPPADTYADSSPAGTCISTSSYSTFRLRTTYDFQGCGLFAGSTGADGPLSTGASVADCLGNCRSTQGVFVAVTSAGFQCRCKVSDLLAFPISNCGFGAERFFFYTQGRAAASAGLSRKRRARLDAQHEFCPAGLTACRVLGSEDGYECIDTANELESCGGCVYGQYGTKAHEQQGVNCAALGDANNMTCKSGRCQAAFET